MYRSSFLNWTLIPRTLTSMSTASGCAGCFECIGAAAPKSNVSKFLRAAILEWILSNLWTIEIVSMQKQIIQVPSYCHVVSVLCIIFTLMQLPSLQHFSSRGMSSVCSVCACMSVHAHITHLHFCEQWEQGENI